MVYLANRIEIGTRIWEIYKVERRLGKDVCIRFSVWTLCKEEHEHPTKLVYSSYPSLIY
jgi:hypothetical protein